MKLKPWAWILIALILAAIVGGLVNTFMVVSQGANGTEFTSTGTVIVKLFGYVGTLFLKLLKMIIVPLVFSSIVVGIAGLGKTEGFGRLGFKTVCYYAFTSLLAIMIGLAMVNIFKPGFDSEGQPSAAIKQQIESNKADYEGVVKGKLASSEKGQGSESGLGPVAELFLRMVPENVFEAFGSNGKMLALIFVAILTAMGLLFIGEGARTSLMGFFSGLNELSLLITNWIMVLAPLGVFGLVAKTISEAGFPIFLLLGKYFFVVLGSLAIHMFVVMPLVLAFFAKTNPLYHFRAMRNAVLTAFSTASSSATLPVTMRGIRNNAGVSNRVTSFVLPLGATVNMDGTALYECIAVMFVAQVLGVEMTVATQFSVVALALLTSIGVAGVPSASLVAITIIITNVDVIPAGTATAVIGLLLAVDRLLDMSRTAVNVFSDSCGTVVIAKSEGETGLYPEKGW
ncbi:dicarboxylate/amino acid:cation symporter [Verrucomicrobiales bacterium]|nr:dicarboxylate/amino acid:cation symporter [Verrucomicrobiales bacterium]MDC0258602.1 dicarboxylate/amino acid:cation symporter [Verrucomicrobiales bacterium]MDC0321816.1 dicarboxylate/amino acid:cation symporter [Verrucomicrobiales bacterium]